MNQNSSRLYVVDALRGFAIISIMLLHNLEHFDFYYSPSYFPDWLKTLDKGIWDSLFFLFSGKSYAIFALLFGLTFFIQSHNQEKIGKDFRGRFAWRLLLLLGFGTINSAFYQGDILTIYAIIGFGLIPFAKLSNKVVLGFAILLMLQPYELINLISGLSDSSKEMQNPASWALFGKMAEYIPKDSLFNTIEGNLSNGRIAVMEWSWENGRVFQTLSLFLLGMLAGRKSLFKVTPESKIFWKKVIIYAAFAFVPLYIIKSNAASWFDSEAIRRPFLTIFNSWNNLAFMLILVSGFVLLFQTRTFEKILTHFSSIGRMSLSNYIIQSILGSFIYYGFGLGLYQYTGATFSLLIGITLGTLQGFFSSWWMKNHRQGPLEFIWHKATWVGTDK
ncbi:DUF418 domain-containing protein [uncultured Bacteroides sp.]|uniref:DUF418 domain-containing protein n=1 Tax=uncultured Bacteroides sp. TaxID=162156 RepID=UPI002AA90F47|nr:DUF418 domain-containing protein [uncultured Bacteroides sp.]